MCQYSATDGVVGAWHQVLLGSFVTGGAGLVMAEATAVVPEGRISIRCPGLWNDDQVVAWQRVTSFARSQNAMIGVQLAHAGRKGPTMAPWDDHVIASAEDGGWTAVAPSALAFEGYPVPHELTLAEIDAIVQHFVAAAARAMLAGFELLEVHAAHGYLLHQFLSPLSNRRGDEYGGSFENRARLLSRIVEALRGAIPDAMPLFVRISATDYTEGGWDLEQSIALAQLLKDRGVDLIDVSSGGNVARVTIPVGPGYQVGFAGAVRRQASIATVAVGLITEATQAEQILDAGDADAVMLARAFLRNPHWALGAAEALGEKVAWPVQFDRARTLRAS